MISLSKKEVPMKFITYSRLKHLKDCLVDYTSYPFINTLFNGYIYSKIQQATFALMNEEDQFEELHEMIENKDYELAILTIENILEEAEV